MEFIPLASPNISSSDIERVLEVLTSGMLVFSKNGLEAEGKLANITQVSHAKLTSNGTSTMHIALKTLGIGPGDEVIIPALSYVATANVVEMVGATPVFVDINLDSFNIDVSQIEAAITVNTKAIIPVHEFGHPAEMDDIMAIADKHNLKVVEDAACALGAKINGKSVGTYGDFGSFSFHPRKSITSGEGGALIFNDHSYLNSVDAFRNHGINIVDGEMDFVEPGFNYRLTDIQAALLVGQLDKLNKNIEYRDELAKFYNSELTNKVKKPSTQKDKFKRSWQSYHIVLESNEQRNELLKHLKNEQIQTNYGAQCIPDLTFYKKKYKFVSETLFPSAYKAYKCGLVLPLYEKLNKKHILYISEKINSFLK